MLQINDLQPEHIDPINTEQEFATDELLDPINTEQEFAADELLEYQCQISPDGDSSWNNNKKNKKKRRKKRNLLASLWGIVCQQFGVLRSPPAV